MRNKELWHEMLTTYCRLMRYENGITLPNMVGAYYCNDKNIDLSSSKCIAHVLNEITNSQKDIDVLIQKCGNIHNYVLSIFKGKHLQLPKLNDKIFLSMYDIHLDQHRSSVNNLAEYLYSLHHEEIIAKKFSVTDGVWHSLSNTELRYINGIINSL